MGPDFIYSDLGFNSAGKPQVRLTYGKDGVGFGSWEMMKDIKSRYSWYVNKSWKAGLPMEMVR